MIPTLKSDDLPRVMARLEDMAKLAPERRKKCLGVSIREVEKNAKRIARSGGVFSRRSTGALAVSLRGRVYSTTSAGLTVGKNYGIVQDHGGVTKPHLIQARPGHALMFPATGGFAAMGLMIGNGSNRQVIYGGRTHFQSGAVAKFAKRGQLQGMMLLKHVHHPGSRIPATNYSWKAYLASRDTIREQIALAALGKGVYA